MIHWRYNIMKDTELLLLSQERYKFLENPRSYILNLHKYDLDKPIKKWYEEVRS